MNWVDWLRALFALTATLGLIAGAALLARRFGMMQFVRAPAERRMRVVERLMLDPRRSLVLVRLDQTEHVLLLSPAGDCVVAKQDAPPAPAPVITQASPEAQS